MSSPLGTVGPARPIITPKDGRGTDFAGGGSAVLLFNSSCSTVLPTRVCLIKLDIPTPLGCSLAVKCPLTLRQGCSLPLIPIRIPRSCFITSDRVHLLTSILVSPFLVAESLLMVSIREVLEL